MIKIRLQGTTWDIKWFLKILNKDRRFITNVPSDFMPIKGTDYYKRVYTEIFRDPEEFQEYKKPVRHEKKSNYFGSGRRYPSE